VTARHSQDSPLRQEFFQRLSPYSRQKFFRQSSLVSSIQLQVKRIVSSIQPLVDKDIFINPASANFKQRSFHQSSYYLIHIFSSIQFIFKERSLHQSSFYGANHFRQSSIPFKLRVRGMCKIVVVLVGTLGATDPGVEVLNRRYPVQTFIILL